MLLNFLFPIFFKMSIDSAWIFRICLVMAVTLILFADFLGYGGANARKNDKSEDYEDYTADDHQNGFRAERGWYLKILLSIKLNVSSSNNFVSVIEYVVWLKL